MGMWHRIESARMPGVTAQQPTYAQIQAAHYTVALHRLERVLRAGGVEAATRTQQRTYRQLVGAYQIADQRAHSARIFFQSRSRPTRSSGAPAVRAGGRAPIRISAFGRRCWLSRKLSRTRRLSRLRATALPIVRAATDRPSRAMPCSFMRIVAANNSLPQRRPVR